MSTEIPINPYLSDPDPSNPTDPPTTRRDENNPEPQSAPARKVDKNNFVQAAITSYDREDMKNDTL
jgi:hypothetical protein